jgi:hypothetical protein
MINQSAFEIGGMVSIWVGNLATDVQFDDYMNLSKKFEEDFGFKINDRAVREAVVESAHTSIEALVRGFSSWESFAPAVVQAARIAGVEQATTMIVFYCVEFAPEKVRVNPNAPLEFIGAFPFSR